MHCTNSPMSQTLSLAQMLLSYARFYDSRCTLSFFLRHRYEQKLLVRIARDNRCASGPFFLAASVVLFGVAGYFVHSRHRHKNLPESQIYLSDRSAENIFAGHEQQDYISLYLKYELFSWKVPNA